MTSSKTREPELRMITRDFYSNDKHHSNNEQSLMQNGNCVGILSIQLEAVTSSNLSEYTIPVI